MILSDTTGLTKGSEKRVVVQCNGCGTRSEIIYSNYYASQQRRGWTGETYCQSCANKTNGKKRIGKPAYNKGYRKPLSERSGKPYMSSDGYSMVFRPKYDVKSKWENYVKEHIAVYEENFGPIPSGGVIHHINGDKLDNRIGNLYLASSEQPHRLLHVQLHSLALQLVRKGLIDFENGQYVANVKLRELLEHPEEDNQQPS